MDIKSLDGVSKERILKELSGMMSAPYFVEKGLPLMLETGIYKIIPGLSDFFEDLKSCTQNPAWHAEGATLEVDLPEGKKVMSGDEYVDLGFFGKPFKVLKCGTVYEHTIHVLEEMSKQIYKDDGSSDFDEHDRFILMMAALLHDIGKPTSARKNGKKNPEDGWGKTKDHDVVGAPLAYDFCKALGMTNDDCETIKWLVLHHMRFHQLSDMKSECKIWMITSHPLFKFGIMLARADERGCRKTKEDEWYGIDLALESDLVKKHLDEPMPARILTGDDIIAKGYAPGPNFKKALSKAYEFQIDDGITDKDRLFSLVKGIVKS